MKKTNLNKKEILALSILTFFQTYLEDSVETKLEKTLYVFVKNNVVEARKHAWLGETVETLLTIDPLKIKTDCTLDGVPYGPKSHDLIRQFFIIHGFKNEGKYPLLKSLQKDKELEDISGRLGRRCYENLELDLQLKHPHMTT